MSDISYFLIKESLRKTLGCDKTSPGKKILQGATKQAENKRRKKIFTPLIKGMAAALILQLAVLLNMGFKGSYHLLSAPVPDNSITIICELIEENLEQQNFGSIFMNKEDVNEK